MQDNEYTLSPEEPKFSRDQVVDTFRIFSKKGFTSPDDLPPEDEEVIRANALLQVWDNQQKMEVKKIGTPEANLEHAFNRSTIHIDAGFSDEGYLDEVANDWLAQDLQAAQDAGLTDLATRIQAKIDEINLKLAK